MSVGILRFGEHTLETIIKRRKKSKRITMRILPQQRQLLISLPYRTPVDAARKLIEENHLWIKNQLQKLSHFPPLLQRKEITLLGVNYKFHKDPLRIRPHLCVKEQHIFFPDSCTIQGLHSLFKQHAEQSFTPLVNSFADLLKTSFKSLHFRDMRSRWGSCNSTGKITLNWRLILAPREVAQYVCLHEVCHLVHMNHSRQFWELVAAYCPLYKNHKKWLKENGQGIMTV